MQTTTSNEAGISPSKRVLAIAVFYVIAVALRYLTNKTSLLAGLDIVFLKTVLQGIGPAAGALAACLIFRIPMRMSLKGGFRSALVPLSIYWLLPVIVIAAAAYFSNGTFPAVTVFTILIYGLLEEIGWRGFLQQLLKLLPKFAGILIVATLWFVWHLDFSLTTSNLLFFGILVLGSWGIGLVADKTNSLLAVAAFHSLNNFFGELNTSAVVMLAVLLTIWILSVVYRKRLGCRIA